MPTNAASIMTQQVITVGPDATVAEVAHILARNGISGVPVCDNDGKLLGMISEGDLLHPFAQDHQLFRSWWLSLLAEGAELGPAFLDYLRSDRRCARDLMTSPVIAASDEATLSAVVDLLQRNHIKRVPIVRDGKLVGVVSRADILSALHLMPDMFKGRTAAHAPIGSTHPHWSSLGSADSHPRSNSPKKRSRTLVAPD